ncbi:type II toxin-antitoxin system VapC family toxin [bacterium]|nr:type II toxin-antitoxin system VapC family toxin [bacterium]
MQAVLDSNIIIDALKGISQAHAEMEQYDVCIISIISWIEVMAGANTPQQKKLFKDFLRSFTLCSLDQEIASRTVEIRSTRKHRLPDAIILATAEVNNCKLVTRNTKDFPKTDSRIRVPYTL